MFETRASDSLSTEGPLIGESWPAPSAVPLIPINLLLSYFPIVVYYKIFHILWGLAVQIVVTGEEINAGITVQGLTEGSNCFRHLTP